MEKKMSGPDWDSWINLPQTKLVHAYLSEVRGDRLELMTKIGTQPTFELVAMKFLELKNQAEGIAEFTELETLKSILVDEEANG